MSGYRFLLRTDLPALPNMRIGNDGSLYWDDPPNVPERKVDWDELVRLGYCEVDTSEEDALRDAKALGWERAHTTLCSNTQCREHRNPWMRIRA